MKLWKKTLAMALALAMTTTAMTPTVIAAVPEDDATSLSGLSVTDQDGDGVIRVACVGDSITAGGSDANYPKYLQEYLNYLGSQNGNTYEVKNHGKGGAAVRHILEDLDGDGTAEAYFYYDDVAYTSSLTYTPDVVIVQMGTNDALFDNWANWDSYFDNDYYEYLVKPYQEKGATVIMSTPPYACNGWHDENVNGAVHDKEVALAEKLGLPIVDTNRLMYGMDEVFGDGLHCNATGYRMMAMNFYKLIFGGSPITATFKSNPYTTIRLTEKTSNVQYIRTTDENGDAALDLLEGSSYTFDAVVESAGCRTKYETISLSSNRTFTFKMTTGGQNVALDGTAFDCGVAVYGENVSAGINDAQFTSGGYQPATWNEGDYCGVTLNGEHEINMLVLSWESASYVSSYNDGGYNLYFLSGDQWTLVDPSTVSAARSPYSGDIVIDTIQMEPAVAIEGVRVEFMSGTITDHKYAPKLYELEIYEWVATPNLSMTLDNTDYYLDETVTMTLSNKDMAVCSISGGVMFDTSKLTCTSLTVSGLKVDDEVYRPTAVSTVETANANGTIGFAYAGGTETYFDGNVILTATFTVKGTGETAFTVYETSDGTEGYSPNQTVDTEVKSVFLKEKAEASLLGDVDLSGKVSAADLTVLACHVGGVELITDAVALANADVDDVAGIAAGDLTKVARYIANIGTL